jgi:selenophosphate synthetase-related protein
MLLETSNCGAVLNLDAIAPPDNIPLEQWLLSFPSYGFLLSVRPEKIASVQACFHEQNLVCSAVGTVEEHHQLVLKWGNESAVFWDLSTRSLMGFSAEGKR